MQEGNLRAMLGVPGVVQLVDVVAVEGGGRWLLMKPVGATLPAEPANTVLRHIGELATTIGALSRCSLPGAFTCSAMGPTAQLLDMRPKEVPSCSLQQGSAR